LFHLVFGSHFGKALANSGEKSEPASDIDTEATDGLKALDPERPIREDRFDNGVLAFWFAIPPPLSKQDERRHCHAFGDGDKDSKPFDCHPRLCSTEFADALAQCNRISADACGVHPVVALALSAGRAHVDAASDLVANDLMTMSSVNRNQRLC